jgi:hypothetical protein
VPDTGALPCPALPRRLATTRLHRSCVQPPLGPPPPFPFPSCTRRPKPDTSLLRAFSHDVVAPFNNSLPMPRDKVSPYTSTWLTSAQEPPPHPGHHRTTQSTEVPLPSSEWAEASPLFSAYPVSSILTQLFLQIGPPLNDLPSSLSCRARPGSSPTTTAHRTPPPPSRTTTRATSTSTHYTMRPWSSSPCPVNSSKHPSAAATAYAPLHRLVGRRWLRHHSRPWRGDRPGDARAQHRRFGRSGHFGFWAMPLP